MKALLMADSYTQALCAVQVIASVMVAFHLRLWGLLLLHLLFQASDIARYAISSCHFLIHPKAG